MNPLPKVAPVSAWGLFICCFGVIWTYISYFSMCSGINQMLREEKAQGFSCLVPFWGSLYCDDLANMLNEIIQKEELAVTPMEKPNMVLCFLFVFLPLSEIFTKYNEVATAFEAKHAATAAPAA